MITGKTIAAASMMLSWSIGMAVAADIAIVRKAPAAPSPWDIAFGATMVTDYNFRGISQSAKKPSVWAYFEPRYNITKDIQLYVGLAGESIDFPNLAAAEIDLYGGIRPTFGPLALDFGFWYYAYPGGTTFNGLGPATTCTNLFFTPTGGCNTLKGNVSFWEVYGRGTYTINNNIAIGGNLFYSPSWLSSGASGTYLSGTTKLTAPSSMLPRGLGAYFSAELGRYWFGTTDAFYGTPAFPTGIKLPDYTTWNLGVGLTYNVFTFDVRYYDTSLSKANCNVLTGDHTASFSATNVSLINPSGLGSSWCGSTVIGKLSVDLTAAQLK